MVSNEMPLTNFQFLYDSFHRTDNDDIPAQFIGLEDDGTIRKFEHDVISKKLDEELSQYSKTEPPEKFSERISSLTKKYEDNENKAIKYVLYFYKVFEK